MIVQFDQVPTEAHHQRVRNRGGRLRHKLNFVKAGSYTMPASAIAELANDPGVAHISLDHKLSARLDYTTAAANAPAVWQSGWKGSGVGLPLSTAVSASGPISGMAPAVRESYTPKTSRVETGAINTDMGPTLQASSRAMEPVRNARVAPGHSREWRQMPV